MIGRKSLASRAIAVAAVAWLLPRPATLHAITSSPTTPWLTPVAVDEPPYGFNDFCFRHPRECHADGKGRDLPQRSLADLMQVNMAVNAEIVGASDYEIYGRLEYWTVPVDRGDCEDYAILKRQRLIAMGWPVSSLLLTVVRDKERNGHAVLTARTVQGDFILDNNVDEVLLWHQTGYIFISRQSTLRPTTWVTF